MPYAAHRHTRGLNHMTKQRPRYKKFIKNLTRQEKDSIRKELEIRSKQSKREKDTRMFERYLVISLAFRNLSIEDIAKTIGRSCPTIYTYINKFIDNGLDGLSRTHSKGRNSYLTDEQKRDVIDTITNKTPESVGFPAERNWTSPLVRAWIKQQWEIEYSERGILDLMYSLNLSYTSPTYTLAKADPVKQEEFKKNSRYWKIAY